MAAQYDYKIGATVDAMTNIEDLITFFPAPKSKFFPFSSYAMLANKTKIGIGRPTAEWHWGFLRNVDVDLFRDTLREYCENASDIVFIKTQTNENENEYAVFQATMLWPEEENNDASRRIDFTVKFINLIPATEPGP